MNRDQWTFLLGTIAVSGAFAGAAWFFYKHDTSDHTHQNAPIVEQVTQFQHKLEPSV